MKLNIGCGNRKLPGYFGIDAVPRVAADLVAPAHAIPLADGCATEILAVHVWEHFYRWECDGVITEWKRLLQDGGRLVLELPDIRKACDNFLHNRTKPGKDPDQLTMWAIYGDPTTRDTGMIHRWGWTPETLQDFLRQHGFKDLRSLSTQFHPVGRDIRDMRIEAVKG
jgi:predicted SAM-dependent methyltransferase